MYIFDVFYMIFGLAVAFFQDKALLIFGLAVVFFQDKALLIFGLAVVCSLFLRYCYSKRKHAG